MGHTLTLEHLSGPCKLHAPFVCSFKLTVDLLVVLNYYFFLKRKLNCNQSSNCVQYSRIAMMWINYYYLILEITFHSSHDSSWGPNGGWYEISKTLWDIAIAICLYLHSSHTRVKKLTFMPICLIGTPKAFLHEGMVICPYIYTHCIK